jgi:hypothetical protein
VPVNVPCIVPVARATGCVVTAQAVAPFGSVPELAETKS